MPADEPTAEPDGDATDRESNAGADADPPPPDVSVEDWDGTYCVLAAQLARVVRADALDAWGASASCAYADRSLRHVLELADAARVWLRVVRCHRKLATGAPLPWQDWVELGAALRSCRRAWWTLHALALKPTNQVLKALGRVEQFGDAVRDTVNGMRWLHVTCDEPRGHVRGALVALGAAGPPFPAHAFHTRLAALMARSEELAAHPQCARFAAMLHDVQADPAEAAVDSTGQSPTAII